MSRPYYQRVPYRLLRLLCHEVNIRVGAGTVRVPLAPVESLAFLYWQQCWKSEIIGALLARRPGTFVDVGANVGTTFLDYLATRNPPGRYVGFEPNPRCVSFLADFIRRNGFQECTLVPTGLADRETILKLHLLPGRDADSAATIVQSLRPHETFETIWVPCFRFDALYPVLPVGEIVLIKIDVEGAELDVLRGMAGSLAKTRPFILCEVLHADAHVDEEAYRARADALRDLVRSMEYTIWHIEKSSAGNISRLVRVEIFPFKRWMHETAEECDYLFVPPGGDAELQKLGFKLTG